MAQGAAVRVRCTNLSLPKVPLMTYDFLRRMSSRKSSLALKTSSSISLLSKHEIVSGYVLTMFPSES